MKQLFLHSDFLLLLILFSSFREKGVYHCTAQETHVRLQTDDTLQGQAIFLNGIQFKIETSEKPTSN